MATTITQSFLELKRNLNIADLQSETVSTRKNSVRKVLEADLTGVNNNVVVANVRRSSIYLICRRAFKKIFDITYKNTF